MWSKAAKSGAGSPSLSILFLLVFALLDILARNVPHRVMDQPVSAYMDFILDFRAWISGIELNPLDLRIRFPDDVGHNCSKFGLPLHG